MNTSEFQLQVSQLERLIGIMYEISQTQQRLLVNDRFEELKVHFELRANVLEKIRSEWTKIESEDGIKQTVTKEIYEEKMQQLRGALKKVTDSDAMVSQLIEQKGQQIQLRLFEMARAKEGAKDYRTIEQATGVVSRVFPENTRFIDEKR